MKKSLHHFNHMSSPTVGPDVSIDSMNSPTMVGQHHQWRSNSIPSGRTSARSVSETRNPTRNPSLASASSANSSSYGLFSDVEVDAVTVEGLRHVGHRLNARWATLPNHTLYPYNPSFYHYEHGFLYYKQAIQKRRIRTNADRRFNFASCADMDSNFFA